LCLTSHYAKAGDPTTDNYLVTGSSFDPFMVEQNSQVTLPKLPTLRAQSTPNYGVCLGIDPEINVREEIMGTLASAHKSGTGTQPVVQIPVGVRRLTPRECERLQGFPDDYTKIGDKTPDGPRYKSLGNSMAVPVMRWIGERIQMVEDLKNMV